MKVNSSQAFSPAIAENKPSSKTKDISAMFKSREVSLICQKGEIYVDKLLESNGFEKVRRSIGSGAFARVFSVKDKENLNAFVLKQAKSSQSLKRGELSSLLFKGDNLPIAQAYCGVLRHKKAKYLEIVQSLEEFDKKSADFDLIAVAMDYVEGKELTKYLEDLESQKQTISEVKFLELALEITQAISIINKKGVIYRDLKPENIMYDPQNCRSTLVDFSEAVSIEDPSLKNDLGFSGTEGFRPPEVNSHNYKPTIKDDSWGLASTLTCMLFGCTLNEIYDHYSERDGGDLSNLQFASWDNDEKRKYLREKFKDLDFECKARLVDLIINLTEKDPEKRLSTMDANVEIKRISKGGMLVSDDQDSESDSWGLKSHSNKLPRQDSKESGYSSEADDPAFISDAENPSSDTKESKILEVLPHKDKFPPVDIHKSYNSIDEFFSENELSKGKFLGKGEFGEVSVLQSHKSDFAYVIKSVNNNTVSFDFSELNACAINHENVVETYFGLAKNGKSGKIEVVTSKAAMDNFPDGSKLVAVVSEKVPGIELFDHLNNLVEDRYYLSVEQMFSILSQVKEALIAIHDTGLLYLDLKTENLMYDEATGKVKIIDFGTSCREIDRTDLLKKLENNPQKIPGSPGYVAPELIQNKLTVAADKWSFAALATMVMCFETPGKLLANSERYELDQDNLKWSIKFSALLDTEKIELLKNTVITQSDSSFDLLKDNPDHINEVKQLKGLIDSVVALTSFKEEDRPDLISVEIQ